MNTKANELRTQAGQPGVFGTDQCAELLSQANSALADDASIEQEIQAKGKTAPRVTPADIEACIASEHYFTAADGVIGAYKADAPHGTEIYRLDQEVPKSIQSLGLLTFCVLVLRNGFTVTGESACASPENFDAEIGRKIARANAVAKIWPFEGYLLKERLYTQPPQTTI